MSDVTGYYYLHTNGDLIFKKFCPESDSDFVRRIWPFIPTDRACAWTICVEALALGAMEGRVQELQNKWGLTNEDATEYASVLGVNIGMDGDSWCATFGDFVDLQESLAGFGDDALRALSSLIQEGIETGSGFDKIGPASELLRQVQGRTP